MRIVFFGTPEFAVASLDRIIKEGHDVAAVVTMPDKIAGRGHKLIQSDVKRYAVQKGIRVLQPERLRDEAFVDELRLIKADIFVVIAFRMMPEIVWNMPPKGTFNLHASLLPKYRGAAPINRAIMNGEKETGVTTFFLQHAIDTGDIIDMRSIPIADTDDAGTIHDSLMMIGADMVAKTLQDVENGTVATKPQPDGDFIAAPKIFAEDMVIDFNRNTVDVFNHIRGLSPYPAARTKMILESGNELEMKISKTKIFEVDKTKQYSPGKISSKNRRMIVDCADGKLEILQLQPAGKRSMAASEFLLGYQPSNFIVFRP